MEHKEAGHSKRESQGNSRNQGTSPARTKQWQQRSDWRLFVLSQSISKLLQPLQIDAAPTGIGWNSSVSALKLNAKMTELQQETVPQTQNKRKQKKNTNLANKEQKQIKRV